LRAEFGLDKGSTVLYGLVNLLLRVMQLVLRKENVVC